MTDVATHDAEFLGSVFGFEIDGLNGVTMFTGCSGLSVEMDVVNFTHVDAGNRRVEMKRAGRDKYTEVVLKRGLTSSKDLHDWFKEVTDAAADTPYKTASIVVYNRQGTEVARFNLEACWPSKLSVSDLSAGSDDVMIEELTIQHEKMLWAPA